MLLFNDLLSTYMCKKRHALVVIVLLFGQLLFSFQDDKAMRFRAGFRRVNVPTPTEYKLQYTWKNSVPEQTPILHAEQLFDSRRVQPSNQQQAIDSGRKGKIRGSEGPQNGDSLKQHRPQASSQQKFNGGHAHWNDVIDGSCDQGDLPNGCGTDIQPKLSTRSPPKQEGQSKHNCVSDTKESKKKLRSHHHHKHRPKKHKGAHNKTFLSEYKREFKVWPIPLSTCEAAAKMQNKAGAGQHGENQVCYNIAKKKC